MGRSCKVTSWKVDTKRRNHLQTFHSILTIAKRHIRKNRKNDHKYNKSHHTWGWYREQSIARIHIRNDLCEKLLAYESSAKPQLIQGIHSQTVKPISPLNTGLNHLHIFIQRRTDVEVGKVDTKSSERHVSGLQWPYNLQDISQRSEESYLSENLYIFEDYGNKSSTELPDYSKGTPNF